MDVCDKKSLFENNVFSSDFFFFATENISSFNELTKILNKNDSFVQEAKKILGSNKKEGNYLYCLSKRWVEMLICEIIKPNVIITMGSSTYNLVDSAIKKGDCGFKIEFDKNKILNLRRNYSNITDVVTACKDFNAILEN